MSNADGAWHNVLPKSSMDIVYFIMIAGMLLNALNWSVVYLISKKKASILLKTDFVYLLLSSIIFFTSVFAIFFIIEKSYDNFFIWIAAIFSGLRIYKYYCYFKSKRLNLASKEL